MVTKRKPTKTNTEKDASAAPARPSVANSTPRPSVNASGKAVARPSVKKRVAEKPAAGKPAAGKAVADKAAGQSTAGNGAVGGAAQAGSRPKPKRRVAMPQSSALLKQHQAQAKRAGAAGGQAAAGGAAPTAGAGAVPGAGAAPTAATGSVAGSGSAGSIAGSPDAQVNSPSAKPSETSRVASRPARPSVSDLSTPRKRPAKRFAVARAESAAKSAAEQLAPSVEQSDMEAADQAAYDEVAAQTQDAFLRRRAVFRRGSDGEEGVQPAKQFQVTWQFVLICAVAALLVAAVAVFSWDRWLRFDDAKDFQGTWYANSTASTITVDGQQLHLTSDVAYDYTLDTGAKTIKFTFGSYEGQGRYRFSADRSELVITDGADFSFWGNLFDDIGWRLGQAIDAVQGKEVDRVAATDGVTVLDRTKTQS